MRGGLFSMGAALLGLIQHYLLVRAGSKTGAFVKHGKEIAAIFATATYPSSDEAFELTETSIKSIGSFNTGE